MCGFLEKGLHDRERERERERQTESDKTVFNGPNCPVGVGPKTTAILDKRAPLKKIDKILD